MPAPGSPCRSRFLPQILDLWLSTVLPMAPMIREIRTAAHTPRTRKKRRSTKAFHGLRPARLPSFTRSDRSVHGCTSVFAGFRCEQSTNGPDYEGLFVRSLSVALPVKRSSARAGGRRALSVLLGEVDEVIMARDGKAVAMLVPVISNGAGKKRSWLATERPPGQQVLEPRSLWISPRWIEVSPLVQIPREPSQRLALDARARCGLSHELER